MLSFGKKVVMATLLLAASSAMATADEKVEMMLTTTCSCHVVGQGFLGDVFAVAVVEVPRSTVEGKSLQQLREGMDAKQYRALQDSAVSACELKAAKNMHKSLSSRHGDLGIQMPARTYCASDIGIKFARK